MKTSDTIAEAPASLKPLPPRVLIADDQVHILEALELLLKSEGYRLHVVRSPAELLMELSCENFDAALIDLNYTRDTTSGAEGLELLQKILGYDSQLPVVVMTAWGEHRPGSGSDSPRGARFYSEAVGKCTPAYRSAHAD